ncbi:MAG: hypothetical protein FRX49_08483 [Trebouxia sp. A1-2]|nr:MAG: hypothetical protein FRX49_08483 [Trebouxia sp. A1-2]
MPAEQAAAQAVKADPGAGLLTRPGHKQLPHLLAPTVSCIVSVDSQYQTYLPADMNFQTARSSPRSDPSWRSAAMRASLPTGAVLGRCLPASLASSQPASATADCGCGPHLLQSPILIAHNVNAPDYQMLKAEATVLGELLYPSDQLLLAALAGLTALGLQLLLPGWRGLLNPTPQSPPADHNLYLTELCQLHSWYGSHGDLATLREAGMIAGRIGNNCWGYRGRDGG